MYSACNKPERSQVIQGYVRSGHGSVDRGPISNSQADSASSIPVTCSTHEYFCSTYELDGNSLGNPALVGIRKAHCRASFLPGQARWRHPHHPLRCRYPGPPSSAPRPWRSRWETTRAAASGHAAVQVVDRVVEVDQVVTVVRDVPVAKVPEGAAGQRHWPCSPPPWIPGGCMTGTCSPWPRPSPGSPTTKPSRSLKQNARFLASACGRNAPVHPVHMTISSWRPGLLTNGQGCQGTAYEG